MIYVDKLTAYHIHRAFLQRQNQIIGALQLGQIIDQDAYVLVENRYELLQHFVVKRRIYQFPAIGPLLVCKMQNENTRVIYTLWICVTRWTNLSL